MFPPKNAKVPSDTCYVMEEAYMCGHTIAPEPNIIHRQNDCVNCASLKDQDSPSQCADPKSVQRANYHNCPKCIKNPDALSQLGVTVNFTKSQKEAAAKNLAALEQAKKYSLAKAVKHSYQQLNTLITAEEKSQRAAAFQLPNAARRTPMQNSKCLLKLRQMEAKLAEWERLSRELSGRRSDLMARRLRHRIRNYKRHWNLDS